MSVWQIELKGREKDIELLSTFLSSSHYKVVEDSGRKFLSLPNISPEANSKTVKEAADRLINTVNGAALLYYHRYEGVSFTSVSRLDKNGKRVGFGYITARAKVTNLTAFMPDDTTLAELGCCWH